jgi:type I restriction enzyme S subunit
MMQAKPIDISPKDLETVINILNKHVPEYEVRAFGSRVKWTAGESSDLDLVIMTDKPLPTLKMAELKDDFSESDLPFRVDIVDWAATKESFRKIIEKKTESIKTGPKTLKE